MRSSMLFQKILILTIAVSALSACGDSTPLPAANGNAKYTPSHGTFAQVAAAQLPQKARATTDCNLDAVNGAPAGANPLSHAATAKFAGWAGDTASGVGKTPTQAQIILHGAHDYAANASTGAPRPDVAHATSQSGLGNSGYELNADLSAVTAGDYQVVLSYQIGNQSLRCEVKQHLTVQ